MRLGWRVVLPVTLSAVGAGKLHAQTVNLTVPLATLEARVARDSSDPLAHYDVAIGYWAHGRIDEAERELRRAVQIEPGLAAGYLALAYLPYARRRELWKEERQDKVPDKWKPAVDESYDLFRRAFLMDPLVDLNVYALVMPPREAIVVGRNATLTYAYVIRGFENFWGANYSQAFHLLGEVRNTLAKGKPKDTPDVLLWYYGLAAAHVEQHQEAVTSFQTLIDRAVAEEDSAELTRFSLQHSNDLRYVLAVLLQKTGRYDEAVALYQEVLSNNLGLYMAHVRLAEIHEARREWDLAIAERARAAEGLPDDPSLRFQLGTALAKARRWDDAAAALTEAMERNPHNARIPHALAQVRLQLGDFAGARAAFQRFVELAPSRFAPQVAEARRRIEELR